MPDKIFTQGFSAQASPGDTIEAEHNGWALIARLEHDPEMASPDQNQDGFWPDRADYKGDLDGYYRDTGKAHEALQAWKNNEWFYVGVVVDAGRHDEDGTWQLIDSASSWGIDCNHPLGDNSYLLEVANDLAHEAMANAMKRVIKMGGIAKAVQA
jgi:hypothetical protein